MIPTFRRLAFVSLTLAVLFLIPAVPAGALLGDVDGSGRVDGMDLMLFAYSFGTFEGQKRYTPSADFNLTGAVDGHDMILLANNFGKNLEYESHIEFRRGEVLVKFRGDVRMQRVDDILGLENAPVKKFYPLCGVHCVAVSEGMSEEVAAARFMVYPEVEYAERNLVCRPHRVPNDPMYNYQWSFTPNHLDAQSAWDISDGGREEVIIAVLDTGVAYENYGGFGRAPDLAGTRFVAPRDFVDNDDHPNDEDGHGTHVSGTVAQTTDNGYGVAGIAYNCSIMPLRVLGPDGGSHSDIGEALRYAVDRGAKVANMSLGGYGSSSTLGGALQSTYSRGMLSFASTGNDANDSWWDPVSYGVEFPASDPNCVAVGATRFDKSRAYYSNYGAAMELITPGGDTRVDQNGDGRDDGIVQETYSNSYTSFTFRWWQGTSMASPHAAAVAGLLVAAGVNEPRVIRDLMAETAEDLGAQGWDQEYGHGLVKAGRAVSEAGGSGWVD